MTIYEVFGTVLHGDKSKNPSVGRVLEAENALGAIEEILSFYTGRPSDRGSVKITELRVWSHLEEGVPEYDPNTLCECHSSLLWKCSSILPPTVSIESDGIIIN